MTDEIFPGPRMVTKNDFIDDDGKPTTKLPYFLNPFSIPNASIVTGSFNIGIAAHLISTPLTFYLITTLDVSATQYSAYSALKTIPWSMKFLWGMLSDEIPILSYRRKSWFAIGWLGFIGVMLGLAFTEAPDVNMIIGLMVLSTVFYLIADVAADSMVIERVRWEKEFIKGVIYTPSLSHPCPISPIPTYSLK